MKTNKTILTLALVIFSGLNTFASSALYLTENKRIDWIKENDESTYKIYGLFNDNPEKYKSRIVQKNEISLSTSRDMDGVKLGSWALALNAQKTFDHCIVDEAYENGLVGAFCDVMIAGEQKRLRYSGVSAAFVGKASGEGTGFKLEEHVTLKKATSTIESNTKVFIREFFKNGKALVQVSGLYAHFLKGPTENAFSSVVDLADLEKREHKEVDASVVNSGNN